MGRFQKGQSGNPGGRPKAIVEVQDLARQETAASIAALVRIRDAADTPPAAVVAAAIALLDRAWGKPVATHELRHHLEPRQLSDDALIELAASANGALDAYPVQLLEHEPGSAD